MNKKIELQNENMIPAMDSILNMIRNNSNFFFYFSPDPDAVGSSIAFALYLRLLNKNCLIYLPEGMDQNLSFLHDMAVYNKIEFVKDKTKLFRWIEEKEPVFLTFDTATHYLLNDYDTLIGLRSKFARLESIELDHHFGGDSEKIYEDSIGLFHKANSTCEIICKYFEWQIEQHYHQADFLFPRNIVLCLLIGLCFDTQFGKFIINKEEYDKWFLFLSKKLEELTWENTRYLHSSKEVFDAINKMNETKEKVLNDLVSTSRIQSGVGLLILPEADLYESLSDTGDSTCIVSKLIGDLSNQLPEKSGNIGILAYYDNYEEIYYLKIRRSFKFKHFDLREIETNLINVFGEYFSGGGGHAGATSFRIKKMAYSDFGEKMEILWKQLTVQLQHFFEEHPPVNLKEKEIKINEKIKLVDKSGKSKSKKKKK